MCAAVRDRFFIVNRYDGKNGKRIQISEHPTHHAACAVAAVRVTILLYDTGECNEEFIVFVGSKTRLDKEYHA